MYARIGKIIGDSYDPELFVVIAQQHDSDAEQDRHGFIQHEESVVQISMDSCEPDVPRSSSTFARGSLYSSLYDLLKQRHFIPLNTTLPCFQRIPARTASDPSEVECRLCGETVPGTQYNDHVDQQHKNGDGLYICPEEDCSSLLGSLHGLKEHIGRMYTLPYACEEPRCTERFGTIGRLTIYAKSHQPDFDGYVCQNGCDEVYDQAEFELYRRRYSTLGLEGLTHAQLRGGKWVFVGGQRDGETLPGPKSRSARPMAPRTTMTQPQLAERKANLKIETLPMPMECFSLLDCATCHYSAATQVDLLDHVLDIHMPVPRKSCEQCGTYYNSANDATAKGNWIQHQRSHQDDVECHRCHRVVLRTGFNSRRSDE
ncbi:hypothetical protein LTR97_005437 [Elasticomyces elasticus]|uniref:C2H2-type domain-containing protein n=1 Tax=Elasticomyces elasticus TaxID=574655 RepID=A0AAN7ZNV2_9PEZI|nr:hypothetical protein LTR97_005437 [Elasticomyces elasticus]